ncbi:PREDICTED: uncharacterized protein LOC108569317 [Nicrophorus vespilloides]|uniref:Uncharacterized protein LOC108569317 n=1 Tax=Nicrophorus vespilloides TaxID=110193 RepID=A0ABM1NHL3_NICVS|nr:PREDICTED: uncharacterized protein LOC108569317 [Nicrophorus vespilloides]
MDEDLDDIRKLNAIIQAENEEDSDYIPDEFLTSDSSDDEEVCDNAFEEELSLPQESETAPNDIELKYSQPVSSELSQYLPPDELEIINNCKDPTLKQLLILNRTKKLQFQKLNHKYCGVLAKTDRLLRRARNVDQFISIVKEHKGFRHRIGYPFFKEQGTDLSYPPLNADALKKAQNKELNFNLIKVRIVWNRYSPINLKSDVLFNYFDNKLQKYEGDLKAAKYNYDEEREEEINEKIREWKDEFDCLEPPSLWDDSCLSWSKIAQKHLKDAALNDLCRAYWNLYAHPKINKAPLNDSESKRLVEICTRNQLCNWEAIAKEFSDDRSPYWLFCYFFNVINFKGLRSRKSKFNEVEDSFLLSIIESQKVGNSIAWTRVADLIKNRNKSQLYRRYMYTMRNKHVKCGPFSEAEDVLIMCLYKTHGLNFDIIMKYMSHRSKDQVQSRFRNYLQNDKLNITKWTIPHDKLVLAHVEEHGKKNWPIIAKQLNRSDAHVRHRYNVLKKYLDKGVPLEEIPRKSQNSKDRVHTKQAVDYYLSTKTLPPVREEHSVGRPLRSYVDCELVNFFRSTSGIRKARKLNSITDFKLKLCAKSIQTVLDALGAVLKIPTDLNSEKSLTVLDRDILNILRNNKKPSTPNTELTLIPPNINTVQACRVLLLKYRNMPPEPPSSPYLSQDSLKFQRRFKSLFYWPFLMSIVLPPNDLLDVKRRPPPPAPVKPVGRPRKNLDKINRMAELKRKKTEMNAANASVPSFKVMPVIESSQISTASVANMETVISNIQKETKGNYLIKIDKATMEKLRKSSKKVIVHMKRKIEDEDENGIATKSAKLEPVASTSGTYD